jgi:transcriptional regulator of nitric oxide reductase
MKTQGSNESGINDMRDFAICFAATAFAVAAPWALALLLESLVAGAGMSSLVFTIIGAPWIAFTLAFNV